jgi:Peptidase inhibitor family I36
MRTFRRALGAATVAAALVAIPAHAASADAVSGTSAIGASIFTPANSAGDPQQIQQSPSAAAATPALGASPASVPNASFATCNNLAIGYFCAWGQAEYSGTMWYHMATSSNSNLWTYIDPDANDEASSLYNHRANATLVSKDMPPSSPNIICIGAEIAYANLTNDYWPDGSDADDSISGFDFLGNNNCGAYE